MKIFEESTMQQEIVLKNCFDCFVELGLEHATIRNLCQATGLKASSIYYRFANKEEIILEATVWGFKNVTRSICWSVLQKTEDFRELFDGLFDEIERNKKQLKFIYQVAGSPRYGGLLRQRAKGLDTLYASFTTKLAEEIGCTADDLLPYVRLFVSVVREYALWDDKELVEKNLQFIYSRALRLRGK